MRAALTAAGKAAAIVGLLVVAISACAHSETAVKEKADPVSAAAADSLIVDLDEVRRITHVDGLTSYPEGDVRQPAHFDSDVPAPCQAAYDQESAYGDGWTRFRSVTYSGVTSSVPGGANKMMVVTQAVGIYPDDVASRSAFDRLVPLLNACSAMHVKYYDFTVETPDDSTVELHYGEPSSSKVIYRVKSSVLIDVVVQGFADSGRIGGTVIDAIADGIQ